MGKGLLSQTLSFFEKTGMDILEHDGSYPGDVCASTKHPGYRGLNDSQWTQWKTITDFYKKYRAILDSDIIHVRRPDGRDIDCILHVNPQLPQKGLAMVYNPLNQSLKRVLKLPLYYTGLYDVAMISEQEGQPRPYKLDRKYFIVTGRS